MIGYAASITLGCLKITALVERESLLDAELTWRKKARSTIYLIDVHQRKLKTAMQMLR